MKLIFGALFATLALAGSAQAGVASRQSNVAGHGRATGSLATHVRARLAHNGIRNFTLYTSTTLDGVVDGISGWPLKTYTENDPAEWASPFGLTIDTLGFVCISVTDPADWCYHKVFIGPVPGNTFLAWFNGQNPTYWDAAIAIMTLTHEANHYKLFSPDEGRVNACALQQFPSVIDTYFGIHPTIAHTVAVRKPVYRKKTVWVKRHGKRVRTTRRIRSVKVVHVQRTVPNPDYTTLVDASRAFYLSQPAPYNTGTCF